MKRGLWDLIQTLNPFLTHWVRKGRHNLLWGKTAALMFNTVSGRIVVNDPALVVISKEGGITRYDHSKASILRLSLSEGWQQGDVEKLRAAVERIGLKWPEEWCP